MSAIWNIAKSTRTTGWVVATAGQTVFNVPFPVDEAADLAVTLDNLTTKTTLTLTTDYAVTGLGGSSATVTLVSAMTAGHKLRIMGARQPYSTADVTSGSAVKGKALNKALDRIVITLQELFRDVGNATTVADNTATASSAATAAAASATSAASSASSAATAAAKLPDHIIDLAVNPNCEIWTNEVYGATATSPGSSQGIPAADCFDGHYIGSGENGVVNITRGVAADGSHYPIVYWSDAPTAGSYEWQDTAGGSKYFRAAYWEMSTTNIQPWDVMGRCVQISYEQASISAGTWDICPEGWYSSGIQQWLAGQNMPANGHVLNYHLGKLRVYKNKSGAGVTGSTAPTHTTIGAEASDGALTWECLGNALGRAYVYLQGWSAPDVVKAIPTRGTPNAAGTFTLTTTAQNFSTYITFPAIGSTETVAYADDPDTNDRSRTLLPPEHNWFNGANLPHIAFGWSAINAPVASRVIVPFKEHHIMMQAPGSTAMRRSRAVDLLMAWDFRTLFGVIAAKLGYAKLASPAFTGAPTGPQPATDDNSTKLATTAWYANQGSATSPAMDGTAATGTSLKFARADHVHPTDTSRAPIASPTFTGTPAAPTASAGTNSTQIATTAFVKTAVDNVVNAAPGALDTLDELAAALGDDANFATTVTTALAAKAPLASPALTGTPTAPTAVTATDSTQIATTAFARAAAALFGNDQGAWTAYTPTMEPTSGAFTTTTGRTGRYIKLTPKTVCGVAEGQVTSVGTGTGGVKFSLPLAAKSGGVAIQCFGTELAVTGNWVKGQISPTNDYVTVYYEGNVSPIATNMKLNIFFLYEID